MAQVSGGFKLDSLNSRGDFGRPGEGGVVVPRAEPLMDDCGDPPGDGEAGRGPEGEPGLEDWGDPLPLGETVLSPETDPGLEDSGVPPGRGEAALLGPEADEGRPEGCGGSWAL